MPLLREYVVDQPLCQVRAVFTRRFTKTPECSNLGAMVLYRAALPVVLGPVRLARVRLLHEVRENSSR